MFDDDHQARIAAIRNAIRSLDRGALHCRYCPAGANNGWRHDTYCAYAESVKAAEEAKQALDALASAQAAPTGDYWREVAARIIETGGQVANDWLVGVAKQLASAQAAPPSVCEWTDRGDGLLFTSCGHIERPDMHPRLQIYKACIYCGNPITLPEIPHV